MRRLHRRLPYWGHLLGKMKIVILYDNQARSPFRAGWGFAALIVAWGRRILFDAGADRLVLEHNVRTLGLSLSGITDIFLSHPHCDHVGGLSYALEEAKGVRIWAPTGMEEYLRPRTKAKGTEAEVHFAPRPRRLVEGLWSTGTMGRGVKEHALIVATGEGPVLVTGCAHPGVQRMAARAAKLAGQDLRLVLGGFHLGGASAGELSRVIRGLKEVSKSVALGHCTGREATAALLGAFPGGEELRVGFSLELP